MYIKTFESFLNENNNKIISLSFKEFLKFSKNEEYLISNVENDVLIEFSNKTYDKENIININFEKLNWNSLMNSSEYNFFRKNDLYTFEDFLNYSKIIFKNKIKN